MFRILLVLVAFAALVGFIMPRFLHLDPAGSMAWWLTNTTAPEVRLAGPPGVGRGIVSVKIDGVDHERVQVANATIDGAPLAPDWAWNLDTSAMPDGDHEVEVQVKDRSLRANTASTTLKLQTDNTPPHMQVDLSPSTPTEGRALVVHIKTAEPAEIKGTVGSRDLVIQSGTDFSWAATGFSPGTEESDVPISLTATDQAGNQATWSQAFTLVHTKYPLEKVELSADFEPVLDPEVRTHEDALLAPIYAQVNGPPRWEGLFVKPVPGEVTTIFGIARTYNAHTKVVHHTGIDFAAWEGEDVHASNNGVVAYTGHLDLRGNVLIVDHGGGVFSTYCHLSEILVQTGDEIKKDEVIAHVGSTGLSTGPHMHWEVWVNGAVVDPGDWTEREMP